MKEIPRKNYYILVILLITTVLLTLSLTRIYKNRDKLVSNFYNYSNKITSAEFDEYLLESSDLIIYISDKYDLTNEFFEKNFEKKIDDLNLKNNLVYIDKKELDKKFLNKLRKEYGININPDKLPIIIVMINKKVIKNVYVTSDSDANTIIDYEAFE